MIDKGNKCYDIFGKELEYNMFEDNFVLKCRSIELTLRKT